MFLAALALFSKRKQKYQNGNIHRKLGVPTSEREGKLSNPRARATRPPCTGKIYRNLQKPARALHARAMHWFCSSQKHSTKALPHLTRIKIHQPGHPTCGSVSRSDSIFKFLEFRAEIFEISREYTGATRPLPLSTHANAAGTAFPPVDLWSVDFVVLWSVDFRSVLGRTRGILVRCSLLLRYR